MIFVFCVIFGKSCFLLDIFSSVESVTNIRLPMLVLSDQLSEIFERSFIANAFRCVGLLRPLLRDRVPWDWVPRDGTARRRPEVQTRSCRHFQSHKAHQIFIERIFTKKMFISTRPHLQHAIKTVVVEVKKH